MYPAEIQKYLDDKVCKNKISRYGKFTKPYLEFLDVCNKHNFELGALINYNFHTIKLCIINNLTPPVCHCGAQSTYGLSNKNIYYAHRCSVLCRSNDKNYCKSISKTKTALYNNKEWKEKTEAKKVKTTTRNYGVAYPMQNIELFEKQQAACFEKDENGLHGYEPYVYPFLCNLYPDIELGTKYLKDNNIQITWKDDNNSRLHRSYPDFFSKSLNTFIEIKSNYTRKKHDYKVTKCSNELYNMRYGYIIVVVEPKKSFALSCHNVEYINE